MSWLLEWGKKVVNKLHPNYVGECEAQKKAN